MLASEISPRVLRASTFKSTPKTPNSEAVKNQYYCRIMIFLHGSAAAVSVNGEFDTVCEKGDVLYLLPNTPYRILNTCGDFEVLNISFDYLGYGERNREYVSKTVFQCDFDPSLCRERVCFDDTAVLNGAFAAHGVKNAADYGLKILEEYYKEENRSERLMSLLMSCIVEELCRREPVSTHKAREKSAEIMSYIRKNCTGEMNAGELEKVFHYHRNHINRLVKEASGMSLKTYILKARLEAAQRLSEETDMTLTGIAVAVGFYDASHFLKTCRRFGVAIKRR